MRSGTFCAAERENLFDDVLSNIYRHNLANLAVEFYENVTTDQKASK